MLCKARHTARFTASLCGQGQHRCLLGLRYHRCVPGIQLYPIGAALRRPARAAGCHVPGQDNPPWGGSVRRTGLVRHPFTYGQCQQLSTDYISGGLQLGSSVCRGSRLVPFSLGTDTAGSGA